MRNARASIGLLIILTMESLSSHTTLIFGPADMRHPIVEIWDKGQFKKTYSQPYFEFCEIESSLNFGEFLCYTQTVCSCHARVLHMLVVVIHKENWKWKPYFSLAEQMCDCSVDQPFTSHDKSSELNDAERRLNRAIILMTFMMLQPNSFDQK